MNTKTPGGDSTFADILEVVAPKPELFDLRTAEGGWSCYELKRIIASLSEAMTVVDTINSGVEWLETMATDNKTMGPVEVNELRAWQACVVNYRDSAFYHVKVIIGILSEFGAADRAARLSMAAGAATSADRACGVLADFLASRSR